MRVKVEPRCRGLRGGRAIDAASLMGKVYPHNLHFGHILTIPEIGHRTKEASGQTNWLVAGLQYGRTLRDLPMQSSPFYRVNIRYRGRRRSWESSLNRVRRTFLTFLTCTRETVQWSPAPHMFRGSTTRLETKDMERLSDTVY